MEKLPIGSKIVFLRGMSQSGEDHPPIHLAMKGDAGEIVTHGSKYFSYYVKNDKHEHTFGVMSEEIEKAI